MNTNREFLKSEQSLYFRKYDTESYKELYERNFKIIKVVAGRLSITSNGLTQTANRGEYIFVTRGIFSQIRIWPPAKGAFRLICININDESLNTFSLNHLTPSYQSGTNPCFRSIEPTMMMDSLFESLDVYAQSNTLPDPTITKLKIEECLHILATTESELLAYIYRCQMGIKKDLVEFMESNYMFNATLQQFAEFSGRSLSTFRRDFESIFGMTPNQWLMERRLKEAYQRISERGLKPSDFYWELGLETISHFSRRFKQRYGLTPSEVRLNSRKEKEEVDI